MSSGKKRHRAVISIPDIPQVFADVNSDDVEYAQDMIDHHCGYECIYFDNGLECPEDCRILHYIDIVNHSIDEQEMLEELQCQPGRL